MLASADSFPQKTFARTIFVPDRMLAEIEDGNRETGYNLAKALIATYLPDPLDKAHFYRVMNGHKFNVHINEKNAAMRQIIDDFLLHGDYEPETTKLFESIVKSGDVCVDAGASHGYFTLLFARLVGETGKVYAFEPTHNQFPYLQANIEANGYKDRVKAFNLGAWSEEIVNNVLNTNADPEGTLHTIALDTVLPEKVDFIKMDIDGSEPEALKGLEQTIKRNPQLKMIIEYYPKYVEKLGLNPKDIIDFLDKYFTYEKVEGDLASEEYWNYFCIRKTD